MRKMAVLIGLFCISSWFFPCYGVKKPLEEPVKKQISSLEDLCDLGEFELSVIGNAEKAAISDSTCAYVEWVYGDKNGDQWASYSIGYSTDTEIKLKTPKGEIDVSARKIRLFLKPSVTVFFKPGDIGKVSEVVKRVVDEEKKPLTFEEFRLDAGKNYFARLNTESYHLPPAPPTFKPVRRQNTIIQISDTPFKDGKSESPITPKYRNWKY